MGVFQSQTVLNDKDIAQDLLTSEKYVTNLVATGTLESSNPQVRSTLAQIHSEMESSARRVFDYLNARGFYNPRPADVQAINDLRRSVDEASRDLQRSPSVGQTAGYTSPTATGYQAGGYGYGGGYQAGGYGTYGPGYYGGGYGGGYQAGAYGTTLPSWAYSEPPRREDRGPGGYGYGGGYGTGYQAGGYGTYGPGYYGGGYGTGYQAGGYGYGTSLPSWAYSEPPRREERGPGGYGTYGPGYYGGGYQAGAYGTYGGRYA